MARFLVVDDDPSAVRGITQLLTWDGHTVSPFTAGADAVKALSTESFDVVLTDLDMPFVDGREVVRVAHEHLPQACLVVVTANARESRDTVLAVGASIVSSKPLDYDELMTSIDACLARQGTAAVRRSW